MSQKKHDQKENDQRINLKRFLAIMEDVFSFNLVKKALEKAQIAAWRLTERRNRDVTAPIIEEVKPTTAQKPAEKSIFADAQEEVANAWAAFNKAIQSTVEHLTAAATQSVAARLKTPGAPTKAAAHAFIDRHVATLTPAHVLGSFDALHRAPAPEHLYEATHTSLHDHIREVLKHVHQEREALRAEKRHAVELHTRLALLHHFGSAIKHDRTLHHHAAFHAQTAVDAMADGVVVRNIADAVTELHTRCAAIPAVGTNPFAFFTLPPAPKLAAAAAAAHDDHKRRYPHK